MQFISFCFHIYVFVGVIPTREDFRQAKDGEDRNDFGCDHGTFKMMIPLKYMLLKQKGFLGHTDSKENMKRNRFCGTLSFAGKTMGFHIIPETGDVVTSGYCAFDTEHAKMTRKFKKKHAKTTRKFKTKTLIQNTFNETGFQMEHVYRRLLCMAISHVQESQKSSNFLVKLESLTAADTIDILCCRNEPHIREKILFQAPKNESGIEPATISL
jgi:hypothetical protein